ncbi:Serine/threonine protein kinase PrkC, regulator of stationary phase [hydrothermal vent metagenome]|uniref:Serine/threonine protein kinase PrkC, regulator of stationary phase n=1 Tax=hydrothermal vent metagenome TaxID=652676 RepID=A0A3B1A5N6_9ZZZZ
MANKKLTSNDNQVASVVSIPGYKIVDILGRGGMAIVYKATQVSIGRTVALKVLAPNHADETFTDRFLREAQIISHLTHPNIITVFDAGVHKSHHYMSMEYISGKTLRDARDDLSRRQKIDVLRQIALALDYAGKKGYVHRDIKPENIMLHEDGRAVLMDFGIARGDDTARGLTLTGKAIGTPYYMSPEQTKGIKVDSRSDIYSFGVVLFQALTGVVPYDGNSFVDIGMKHITEAIPSLPRGLESFQVIVNTAMSKDPEHRYQTAGELIVALDKIALSELDFIDAKSAVIANKNIDYDSATIVESDIKQPVASADKNTAKLKGNIKPGLKIRSKTQYQNKVSSPKGDVSRADEYPPTKWRRRFLSLLLLMTLAAGVYFNQSELKLHWKKYAVPLLHEYLPEDIKLEVGLEKRITKINNKTNKLKKVKKNVVVETLFNIENFKTKQKIEKTVTLTDLEIEQLFAELDTNPSNSNSLILYYKNILNEDKSNIVAHKGVNNLRKWFLSQINNSVKNNDVARGKMLLTILKNNFPSIVHKLKYQKWENMFLRKESITAHLRLAEEFFNKKHYIEPPLENAHEQLMIVLADEPDNITAKAMQQKMLDIFVEQIKNQQAVKNYESAIISAESGLVISKNDAFLKSSLKQLKKLFKQQQNIDKQLALAKIQMDKGNFVTPANNNAFKIYYSVLEIEKNNKSATKALKQIELKLANQATQAIKSNNISNAKLILQLLEQFYPDSSHLKKTQTKLAEQIDSKNPTITKIVFSDVLMSSMVKMEDIRIQSGKRIYFGIKFKNFSAGSSYLLVNLLDHTAITKLEQKTIKLNGIIGEQIFFVEIPGEGLTPGNYYVEVKHGKKSLIKKSFQVFKP